jgi:hypothetical protein
MWKARNEWGIDQVDSLISSLRPEDIDEIETSTGMTAGEAVMETIVRTYCNGTVYAVYRDEDNEFMGFMGLIPMIKQTNLWVLTRDITDSCPRDVMKYGRLLADSFYEQYGSLYSIVNKNNRRTLLLCKAMGFTPGLEHDDYKGSGMTFQYMHRS